MLSSERLAAPAAAVRSGITLYAMRQRWMRASPFAKASPVVATTVTLPGSFESFRSLRWLQYTMAISALIVILPTMLATHAHAAVTGVENLVIIGSGPAGGRYSTALLL